jgi:hypothetical protein
MKYNSTHGPANILYGQRSFMVRPDSLWVLGCVAVPYAAARNLPQVYGLEDHTSVSQLARASSSSGTLSPGQRSATCRLRMRTRCAKEHAHRSAHEAPRRVCMVSWDHSEQQRLLCKEADLSRKARECTRGPLSASRDRVKQYDPSTLPLFGI